MRTEIVILSLIACLASFSAEALVVEDSDQLLGIYMTSQRWFSTPPATSYQRNGRAYNDSLSWVRTDDRNQFASVALERNATVTADSIVSAGSIQISATHGDAFDTTGLCFCVTSSQGYIWSEFWFEVNERSTYALDWDLIDQAMLPGIDNEVSIVLQSLNLSSEHSVDLRYTPLADFNAMGVLDSGRYYLGLRVWSGTNQDWLSFPPASSTGASTSFSFIFQTAPVPLPASLWLLLSGLTACGLASRGPATLAAIAAAMRRWPAAFG